MSQPWPKLPSPMVVPNYPQDTLLGPQPATCCPSCRIIARAVARLAYHLGYDETGDELTELLAEDFREPRWGSPERQPVIATEGEAPE